MRSRKLAIGFGLLFTLATAVPALAQSSSGVKEPYPAACTSVQPVDSDRAHKLYEAGKAYYDEGNYDSAIAQFREAYKKDCTKHDLLVIISRAYELNRNSAEAIRALETYLEPQRMPNAIEHRTKIENLKKDLARQNAAAAAAATAPPAKPVEIREHSALPWIVVGVGGAAIIAGIVVLATAPSLPDDCDPDNNTCKKRPNESTDAFNKRQETAGRSQTQPVAGAVVTGIGGVFVIGGLLWHFLEPTGPVEATTGKVKPKVTPQAGPGFAGLALGGTF